MLATRPRLANSRAPMHQDGNSWPRRRPPRGPTTSLTAFGSGGSVRAAIERHEISSGLLYTWRKQAMSGELTGIAPVAALPDFAGVRIAAHQAPIAALPPPPSPDVSGRISIELPSGIRINVDAQVDAAALARVLAVLPS